MIEELISDDTMLTRLGEIEANLSELWADEGAWKGLDIDYEPPRVERLWRQVGDFRVCLHRIHPCETALMHPHPWPSAMKVVKGTYEMRLAHGPSRDVATLRLSAGSAYAMTDPRAWHSVRPVGGVAHSLMVMGPTFESSLYDHTRFGQHREFKPLSDGAVAAIVYQHLLVPELEKFGHVR